MKFYIEAIYKNGGIRHAIETDSFDNPRTLATYIENQLGLHGVLVLEGMVIYAKGLKALCVTKTEK